VRTWEFRGTAALLCVPLADSARPARADSFLPLFAGRCQCLSRKRKNNNPDISISCTVLRAIKDYLSMLYHRSSGSSSLIVGVVHQAVSIRLGMGRRSDLNMRIVQGLCYAFSDDEAEMHLHSCRLLLQIMHALHMLSMTLTLQHTLTNIYHDLGSMHHFPRRHYIRGTHPTSTQPYIVKWARCCFVGGLLKDIPLRTYPLPSDAPRGKELH